ncbi:MAG: tetratricopeptide repeat protein [Pirellulales bacterium]
MNLPQLLSAAFEHHQAGHADQAEQLYRQILAVEPHQPDTLHLLGVLCMQSGKNEQAVELISQSFALRPTHVETANHLGAAYGALGRYEEAVTVLRRAAQMAPQDASIHYNLGTALRNANRPQESIVSLRHAVAADPKLAEAHYNLGNTLRELKQYDQSEASYRAALAARPDYIRAIINLGHLLRELKRYDEAIDVLQRAIAIDPNHAGAHTNLGTTIRDTGRYAEAVPVLQRAIELNPLSAEAYNNLGTTYHALGQSDEAGRCYDEALRINPELADAHLSRATWRLRNGDLAGGFEEYEWRWKTKVFADRGFAQPRWNGEELSGRTILLYAEQGLGDTLHFVRLAALARQRGGRVIVECHAPLVDFLAGCSLADVVIPLHSPLPAFDVHAPLMSLPHILKLTPDQFWHGPYLAADPQRVAFWRQRLAPFPGFRVGICWRGNREHVFDAQRTLPLAALAPLARVPGVRLVNLQKDATDDELSQAGVEVIGGFEHDARPTDSFADAAAVIQQLDLVITVDTSVAHLAGGLATPTWVAISANPDWRWQHTGDRTPWYPTLRLFRQEKLHHWDEAIERIARELAKCS